MVAGNIEIPRELDWVAKRAACTVTSVFRELCLGIESDVRAINAARDLASCPFGADMTTDNSTLVIGQYNVTSPRPRVIVGMHSEGIHVKDEASQTKWSACVTLNDEGRCVLELDGKTLEQWQFRKRALQYLFFGEKG